MRAFTDIAIYKGTEDILQTWLTFVKSVNGPSFPVKQSLLSLIAMFKECVLQV